MSGQLAIEWDEAKRRANLRKHGLDFADVSQVDWDTALLSPDARFDYGEDRFVALGMFEERLHVICFTLRKGAVRIISFRAASRKERKCYEQENEDQG